MDLRVDLGERAYPIYFRQNGRKELIDRVKAQYGERTVLVISDDNVADLYAADFTSRLTAAGTRAHLLTFRGGEASKSLATVNGLYERALDIGVDRQTPVIAYGGGVVGDVSGFFAATMLRGLPYIQVPTTILAQVDSSVGGKVGVNFAKGKNLIGSFYQPRWVFCDSAHFKTLDPEERRSGLVEAIKHALLADRVLFDAFQDAAKAIVDGDDDRLIELLPRVVEIKSQVVAEDEHENGKRILLNLGHTLGHAFEASDEQLRHGDAVGLGIRATLAVSETQVGLSSKTCRMVENLLDQIGGPKDWKRRLTAAALDLIGLDKKTIGERLNFIALRAIADPVVLNFDLNEFKALIGRLARPRLEERRA